MCFDAAYATNCQDGCSSPACWAAHALLGKPRLCVCYVRLWAFDSRGLNTEQQQLLNTVLAGSAGPVQGSQLSQSSS